jgi:hypothetical protein
MPGGGESVQDLADRVAALRARLIVARHPRPEGPARRDRPRGAQYRQPRAPRLRRGPRPRRLHALRAGFRGHHPHRPRGPLEPRQIHGSRPGSAWPTGSRRGVDSPHRRKSGGCQRREYKQPTRCSRPTQSQSAQVLSSLPIFPLPNVVLLPGMVLPLNVFEPRYLELVDFVREHGQHIGVPLLRPPGRRRARSAALRAGVRRRQAGVPRQPRRRPPHHPPRGRVPRPRPARAPALASLPRGRGHRTQRAATARQRGRRRAASPGRAHRKALRRGAREPRLPPQHRRRAHLPLRAHRLPPQPRADGRPTRRRRHQRPPRARRAAAAEPRRRDRRRPRGASSASAPAACSPA